MSGVIWYKALDIIMKKVNHLPSFGSNLTTIAHLREPSRLQAQFYLERKGFKLKNLFSKRGVKVEMYLRDVLEVMQSQIQTNTLISIILQL